MSIEGIRVVRGPDWSLGKSDGGEGHVGTVTKVKADHTVDVQWDMGEKTTCRTGKGNKCDLRIFDSAPSGLRHNSFNCDDKDCNQRNIPGTRWHCSHCTDFDLCSSCYFKDKHNIQHVFFRFDAPGLSGEKVQKRSTSDRLRSWGTFEEASVRRGPDWKYDDQDGGDGKVGTVVEVKKWSSGQGTRDSVIICWPNNHLDHYRLGYSGKVDVICVEAAPGTDYYKDHLLALNTANIPKASQSEKSSITGVDCQTLKKGDKVCIQLPEVALKERQKGHGGFSVSMTEFIGQHGVVKKVEDNGDVVATFDDKEWRLFSGAVRKVPAVKVGEKIQIIDDTDKVQAMQKRHGGWVSEMAPTLGKVGKVVKIDSDGDVAVAFGGTAFVYNPACCSPVTGNQSVDIITDEATALNSNCDAVGGATAGDDDDDKDEDSDQLTQLMAQLFLHNVLQRSQAAGPKQFVSAAASDNASIVKAMLKAEPNIVNKKDQGLTALIIASHKGHTDVVNVLLKGKADLDITEDKGNTALMAALMKKHEDIAKMLINAGANINTTSGNKLNALHHAVLNGANSTLQLLIAKKGNVNQQDSDGDTPLHCAILKKNNSGVAYLLTAPTIDVNLCNNKDHNPIRLAAMKDDEISLSKLLAKAPELLNTPSVDGCTALHVGAVNDNIDVMKTLIKKKAEIDPTDNKQMTPLHMACVEGYVEASTLLVENGASLAVSDKDGDTALHMCLLGRRHRGDMDLLARMIGITMNNADETKERIKIACYLIEKGADVSTTNNRGRRPIQCCNDDQVRDAVKKFADSQSATLQSSGASGLLHDLFTFLPIPCVVDDCERMADAVFKPCGHKVCCQQCSVRIDECPICDKPIVERRSLDGQKVEASPCKVQ